MRIRLIVDINGFATRSDGSYFDWPGRGGEVDVEDHIAVDMINSQQAVPVSTFGVGEDTSRQHDPTEEQRMGTAGREFVRPQSPPQVSLPDAPSPEPVQIELNMGENVDLGADVDLSPDPKIEPYLEPQPEATPVKRGPGRPRKEA